MTYRFKGIRSVRHWRLRGMLIRVMKLRRVSPRGLMNVTNMSSLTMHEDSTELGDVPK
jgi:hypothetical protein